MATGPLQFFAPLLGNFQLPPSAPNPNSANIVRGPSSQAVDLLGLANAQAVPFDFVEPISPTASSLTHAISGFFSLVQGAYQALAQLSTVVGLAPQTNTLQPDQTVTATTNAVAALNALTTFISNNADSISPALASVPGSPLQTAFLRNTLQTVGISIDPANNITVNATALRAATIARPNDVANALGLMGGLATQELNVLSGVLTSAQPAVVGFSSSSAEGNFLLTSASSTPVQKSTAPGLFVDVRL